MDSTFALLRASEVAGRPATIHLFAGINVLEAAPPAPHHVHACRWFKHISRISAYRRALDACESAMARAEVGASKGAVNITLLPLSTGAAALDGSPYGFYFVPSQTGSTKWSIFLNGGGWCYNEGDCKQRAQTDLGSSKGWDATKGCSCYNVEDDGSGVVDDCNCLNLPYCDGASFSGNYEVLTDDADLDKIVVTVEGPAPRHKVHYESKGLEEGSFTIEAQHSGSAATYEAAAR